LCFQREYADEETLRLDGIFSFNIPGILKIETSLEREAISVLLLSLFLSIPSSGNRFPEFAFHKISYVTTDFWDLTHHDHPVKLKIFEIFAFFLDDNSR
jgi:hypothetical protein